MSFRTVDDLEWDKESIERVQRRMRRDCRESFAERVRKTVKRAESDTETWIFETLETEEILG